MKLQEALLRKTIPVVINSYNQPTYLERLVESFFTQGFKNIVVVDNSSESAQLERLLIEMQVSNRAFVLKYPNNRGPRAFHLEGFYKLLPDMPHLYTDPDVEFDMLSDEFVTTLISISDKFQCAKVGSGIEIPPPDDCKEGIFPPLGLSIADNELRFWREEIEELIFQADIDTTLHLFNPKFFDSTARYFNGIRVCRAGFMIRHKPYYKCDGMPDDERDFYLQKTRWSNYFNPVQSNSIKSSKS